MYLRGSNGTKISLDNIVCHFLASLHGEHLDALLHRVEVDHKFICGVEQGVDCGHPLGPSGNELMQKCTLSGEVKQIEASPRGCAQTPLPILA